MKEQSFTKFNLKNSDDCCNGNQSKYIGLKPEYLIWAQKWGTFLIAPETIVGQVTGKSWLIGSNFWYLATSLTLPYLKTLEILPVLT